MVAIALQVLYYLSIFEIVDVDVASNFWLRFLAIMPSCFIGYIVVDSCAKHIRKWLFKATYLLSLVCGVAAYLNISGVYLGAYTYEVIFITVFPLSYGGYLFCSLKLHLANKECKEQSESPLNFFAPTEPEEEPVLPPTECTKEDMLDQLPQSAQVSDETLLH